MSSIDKIVKKAGGPRKTPGEEAREEKDKKEEIVKELVKETTPQQPPVEKRKPGRPRSNSTDKAPKSPRIPDLPLDSAPKTARQQEASPGLTPAQKINNSIVIRNLTAHVHMFPEVVKDSLDNYNPHMHTPEENQGIIDNIVRAARDSTSLASMPFMIHKVLTSGEEMAMYWALANPGNKASPTILDLNGISSAIMQDPVLSTELKLLQCEAMKYMPDSPILRIGLGLASVVTGVLTTNRQRRQFAMRTGGTVDPAKYEEF